jgi:hypothetical protein
MLHRALALALALGPAALADAEDAVKRTEAASLRLSTPIGWTQVPAPSDVRAAQFQIPRASGDAEDGELILFFFGAGKGGGVEDNLARWYAQFEQPDGRPSRDAGVVVIRTVNGLRVTSLDLSGTHLGMRMPGGPAPTPKPGWRLLAAVVETTESPAGGPPGGPWFFKATGPTATIAAAKADFDRMLASLEYHR